MQETAHPVKLFPTLVVSFLTTFSPSVPTNLSAKNAEVNDDAIKALIT